MEWLAIIPLVVAGILLVSILYMVFTTRGRSKTMQGMMKSNMDVLKDMANGEMGETFKELSKTAINIKKDILEENQDTLKEIAETEANIEVGAIKKKAAAVKEGFTSNSEMFCKHCGVSIDSDSKYCNRCGKEQ